MVRNTPAQVETLREVAKGRQARLADFERDALEAVRRAGEAWSGDVTERLRLSREKVPKVAHLLMRMEERGLLTSRMVPAGEPPNHEGSARRYYKVAP